MKVFLIFLGGLAALLIGTLALNKQHPQGEGIDAKRVDDDRIVLPASQAVAEITSHIIEPNLVAFTLSFTVRDGFDQFIYDQQSASNLQQPSVETVLGAYRIYAASSYSANTVTIAVDLFSRYVNYKVTLSSEDIDVDLSMQSLNDVAYKLEERELLRRRFFSDNEYYYLFSQDALIDEAALKRMQIAQENTLDKAQRKTLILEHLENSSEAEKTAFQGTVDMHKIQQIKHKYVDANVRYNAIAAEFGHEVAERFSKTWEKQTAWKERLAKYEAYKVSLQKNVESVDAISQAISRYETLHFDSNEIKRLRVLSPSPAS